MLGQGATTTTTKGELVFQSPAETTHVGYLHSRAPRCIFMKRRNDDCAMECLNRISMLSVDRQLTTYEFRTILDFHLFQKNEFRGWTPPFFFCDT